MHQFGDKLLNEANHDHGMIVAEDFGVLENVFKTAWEKVRAATELINRLRNEQLQLTKRVSDLEDEVRSLHADITNKEQELKRLRLERSQMMNTNDQTSFSEDERENLKNKIRDLIAKINSHL
ncbi:MAG TPA: hypothetical protein VFF29_07960 [Bacteroidota bacterium]|nr:hypothetical protein [Bacteroidota bacterium]